MYSLILEREVFVNHSIVILLLHDIDYGLVNGSCMLLFDSMTGIVLTVRSYLFTTFD